jgi:hypothetical protein
VIQDDSSDSLLGRLLASRPVAELRVLRGEIAAELETTHKSLLRLQLELAAVDREMQARASDSNGPEPATPSGRPAVPLRRAILMVLRERPGTWTRDELLDELRKRDMAPGGKNPRNTLVTRLSEMANEGLIDRMGNGYGITPFRPAQIFNEEEVPAM